MAPPREWPVSKTLSAGLAYTYCIMKQLGVDGHADRLLVPSLAVHRPV